MVFDHLQPAETADDRAHLRARADRLARAGEPLVNYVSPGEIHGELEAFGFTVIEDLTAGESIGRYLDGGAVFDEPPRALRASRILRARR